jgi:hypothetical protein
MEKTSVTGVFVALATVPFAFFNSNQFLPICVFFNFVPILFYNKWIKDF